jgi:hypothetical protein
MVPMEQRPRTQYWFEIKKFPKKILAPIARMAQMSEINKMVPVSWVPNSCKMKKYPEKILMMQTMCSQKRKS